jgi:hypothetical protein
MPSLQPKECTMMKTLKYSLATILCSASLLCAGDAPLGQRAGIAHTEKVERQAAIPQQEPLSERRTEQPDRPQQENRESMAMMGIHSSWVHARHTAMGFGYYNDWVQLEDGTKLTIPYSERGTVAWWAEGDLLYILPSSGWWWSSEFRLHNVSTGEIVDVNLSNGIGPIVNGPYSLYISAIDDYQGLIYLQNGSVLSVDPRDLDLLHSWHPGDYIITGTNDDWAAYRSPNILINVATVNYIRVQPIK